MSRAVVFGIGLVGALSLDVATKETLACVQNSGTKYPRLLALVASTLTGGLGRAISAEMSDLATVVALLTLGAVTAHVAITAAAKIERQPQFQRR